jgi:(1->4)-alpha-D-glucan 1-alpha-D-glucosylmutase
MTLLKFTVPGVPDVYQGDELESLNLVDPDNRRPVDWDARRRVLAKPPAKLHVIKEALALRRRSRFGEYRPLDLGDDVCAFLRGDDVAVAVPLRGQDPPELGLPGKWRSVLDEALPVRLLERVQ